MLWPHEILWVQHDSSKAETFRCGGKCATLWRFKLAVCSCVHLAVVETIESIAKTYEPAVIGYGQPLKRVGLILCSIGGKFALVVGTVICKSQQQPVMLC